MQIIIYSINYYPELTGIGKYNGEMAEWLSDNNHQVTVITAPPYYPDWKVSDGYSSFLYKSEIINGVKVIRCPVWVPAKPSGLKRLLHLASFAISSAFVILWKALRIRPDIVFVVEPPFFCAPLAIISARLVRARAWLHIQDFEIDAAFSLGLIKSNILRKLVLKIESWILKRFDIITTISTRMLKRIIEKGVQPQKCKLFENWVDIERIYPMHTRPSLFEQLHLPENRFIVLYSGNMGEKQGLEIIIDVASMLQNRTDLLFLMCGTGSSRERLKEMSNKLNNVAFISLQPVDKLNELLNLADIHLLPQKSDAEDLVMPSKLTNMMASGRPVIATAAANTQVANVVADCGIVVEPGDTEAFCNAIKVLVEDVNKAESLGFNGRKYAEQHWNKYEILSDVFS